MATSSLAADLVATAHSRAEQATEQALTAIREGKYAYAATLLRGSADYAEAAQRVTSASGGETVAAEEQS